MPNDKPNTTRTGVRAIRRQTSSRTRVVLAALVLGLGVPAGAMAQAPVLDTYGGGFWSRPRLTGDWLGFRDQMAKRGVTIDLDLSQILQGVGSGGRGTDVGFWGLVTLDLQVAEPGLKKTLGPSGQLRNVDTAVIGGLRAFVRF